MKVFRGEGPSINRSCQSAKSAKSGKSGKSTKNYIAKIVFHVLKTTVRELWRLILRVMEFESESYGV